MLRARREAGEAAEVQCEGCQRTVPRLQTGRCATCKRTLCRLCARWYGHFMLVCEECRAAEW
jgi:hypothetical protein